MEAELGWCELSVDSLTQGLQFQFLKISRADSIDLLL